MHRIDEHVSDAFNLWRHAFIYNFVILIEKMYSETILIEEMYSEKILIEKMYSETILIEEMYSEKNLIEEMYSEKILIRCIPRKFMNTCGGEGGGGYFCIPWRRQTTFTCY